MDTTKCDECGREFTEDPVALQEDDVLILCDPCDKLVCTDRCAEHHLVCQDMENIA